MKSFKYIAIIISLALTSCYKDIGNYDYDQVEEITISGVESSYTAKMLVDVLQINPTLSSSLGDDVDFECFWGIYHATENRVDTISYERNLNYEVNVDAGTWYLLFAVKNKDSGYTKYLTSTLNVSTDFTRGWYALKDDGENSDIDQYTTEDTIVPSLVLNNVYSNVNGKKMAGEAQMLNFLTSYKTYVTGASSAANTRTLVALTNQDATFNYINNMETVRDFTTFSYAQPQSCKPQYIGFSVKLYCYLLINAGKLRSIYTMALNSGVFGYEVARNDARDDYELSKYAITGRNIAFFYDEMSSSFVGYNYSSSKLINATASAANQMPLLNTNKELLFLGMQTLTGTTSVAFMKDKNEVSGANRYLVLLSGNFNALTAKPQEITADQKIYDGSLFTNSQDEEVIYFVSNKTELWSRNLASGVERLQFKSSDDQEITMVKHRKYSNAKEEPFNYNYLIVATSNSGNEYEVRFFSKTAGNLNETPDFIMKGDGRVKDVMYISPLLSESTYMQGY
ncbi:MAG: PKD-like family lipoprotein [Mangrovibacterium sp.]